jgi:pimeloyl-ACP methyl ester carboxylesterase
MGRDRAGQHLTLVWCCVAAGSLVLGGCSTEPDPTVPSEVTTESGVGSSGEATGGTSPDAATRTEPSTTAPVSWTVPEPPGALVDVDGHRMHLHCTGEGGRTVLLEAGLWDPSLTFWPLQDELATTSRVCSYDRSGHGWSEPGPQPRTGRQIVGELEALLEAAGESGPYVVAGHGSGGLLALLFAQARPQDVAGVVLIDPAHPEEFDVLEVEVPRMAAAQEAEMTWLEDAAAQVEAGELDVDDALARAPRELPPDLREQWAAVVAQPHSLRTTVAEWRARDETMSQVGGEGALGDIPLVVIAAGRGPSASMPARTRDELGLTSEDVGRHETLWRSFQEDLMHRSTDSRLVIASHSTHAVHLAEPDVVLEAIRSLTR